MSTNDEVKKVDIANRAKRDELIKQLEKVVWMSAEEFEKMYGNVED